MTDIKDCIARRISQLTDTGMKILRDEELSKEAKVAADRHLNQTKWVSFYGEAVSKLPFEVRPFLTMPKEARNGDRFGEVSLASYLDWQLVIPNRFPIYVRFNTQGEIDHYIVALAEPTYNKFCTESQREFKGGYALECALAFALLQAGESARIEEERTNRAKEIEEQEARKAREPEYQDVDGSEPVPDQVLITGIRNLIQDELRKVSNPQ